MVGTQNEAHRHRNGGGPYSKIPNDSRNRFPQSRPGTKVPGSLGGAPGVSKVSWVQSLASRLALPNPRYRMIPGIGSPRHKKSPPRQWYGHRLGGLLGATCVRLAYANSRCRSCLLAGHLPVSVAPERRSLESRCCAHRGKSYAW